MVQGSADGNRHSRILALLLAKTRLEVDFLMQAFFFDKLLKGLNDIVGTFYVARAADAHA
jgi:hypothetical protein